MMILFFRVIPGYKAVAEKVMLEKWHTRWNNEEKGQIFKKFQFRSNIQIKIGSKLLFQG